MFRTVKLFFGLLKLACILVALYIFLLAIAIFVVVKFVAATKKID
jgi:hypothetical protein